MFIHHFIVSFDKYERHTQGHSDYVAEQRRMATFINLFKDEHKRKHVTKKKATLNYKLINISHFIF